ncbi:hypothetical protein K8S17_01160, partial [bacterium]|nr:hypothetical protein [bacterium]
IREISDALLPGLDYSREVAAVHDYELGDTFYTEGASGRLDGFAVLRTVSFRGQDSSGRAYLHVLAIRPGADEQSVLTDLLKQVWCHAVGLGFTRIVTGVNGRYRNAAALFLKNGFRGARAAVRMASISSLPDAFSVSSHVNISRWAG